MGKARSGLVPYYRVSTDKQGRSGLGLEAQKAAVRAYAARMGYRIVAEFVEVETGRRNDRPELDRAKAAARRHKATLAIAKLDRLSRRVHFISGLMESGVDFIAVDSPDDDPFILHMKASFAEEEARKISQRTKAALAALKARGVELGKPENLSLAARVKGAGVNRNQAIIADALIAPLIRELRAEGLSLNAIAGRLNDAGQVTRTGVSWNAMQAKRVLERSAKKGRE